MDLLDRLTAYPLVRTAMDVQKRTKRDAADQFAAAVAFFGFISLVPLIAIAVSVAAAVLADDPSAVERVVDAITEAIPGLGASEALQGSIDTLVANGGTIGLVGGVVLLFTGMRITNALQTATRFVFGLPLAKAGTVTLRLWQVASLVLLGLLALGSVALASFAQTLLSAGVAADIGNAVPILVYVFGGLLDIVLFWAAYRIYSIGGTLSWRDLLPGAILGGIGWSLLKYFGATYVARQADSFAGGQSSVGSGTVAVLASLVGLLLLFYLAGRLYVYGAELIAELAGVGTAEETLVATTGPDAADTDARPDSRTGAGAAGEATAPADGAEVEPVVPVVAAVEVDDASLADRFRERGRLVDDDGDASDTGREVVPWQPPAGSPLKDRRTRQAAAFASSALAVLTAGLLGRRS